jgi:hypothetical protein
MSSVAMLNRPSSHFLSFLSAEGLSCHRAGEVTLCVHTWIQQSKDPLWEKLEEMRRGRSMSSEEWERSLFITTSSGRQVRTSKHLILSKEDFPVEVILKDTSLRIYSRGLGGPGKLYQRICALIRIYARTFVVCQQCRSSCTDLLRDRKLHHTSIELICRKCSARRFVSSSFNTSAA